METSSESDIAPLISDDSSRENLKIINKKIECCDFLQCGACTLIILFTCFKP